MAYERTYIRVPDFQYSADYYPQIVAALRRAGRINAPEITNEDAREPFIQLERAFALAMHYDHVLLDMVANSMFLKTATIPESVKLILELIGYSLFPAGPARVDMLAELSGRYAAPAQLLDSYRKFATKRIVDIPETIFENPAAYDLSIRNDEQGLGYAYGVQYERTANTGEVSSVYTDVLFDNTAPFTQADVNKYMSISESVMGNNTDDLRIVEVFDMVGATYRRVRLQGGSFVSENNLTWTIRTITASLAGDWNTNVPHDPLPGGLTEDDKIYIGHPDVMWDRFDVTLSAPVIPGYIGRWEYYDPNKPVVHPDSVEVVTILDPPYLRFYIDDLLGTQQATRTIVEVTYIPTGAKFRTCSSWSLSGNHIWVPSFLGQSDPSTNVSEYLVTADWKPVIEMDDETVDGDSSWSTSGQTTFTLPQTQTNKWSRSNIYDQTEGEEVTGYFLRYRIIDDIAGDSPIPERVRIDRGKQYILVSLVQGQTVEDAPLASSSGETSQSYTLTKKPYILVSGRVFVDEGGSEYEWTVVKNFTRSKTTDRHCIIDPQTDGTAVLRFGNGVNGKIPPIGINNIRVVYRIGADTNGNIGANTLTVNRDGAGVFRSITNPRQGKYWIPADWSSQSALEQAKDRGPKVLGTMRRCVSGSDAEVLARTFTTISGARPVARAKAYEEAYGPKTIGLVVCGGGGAALSSDEIDELEEYFNGGSTYGYPGIVMANHQIYVSNYIPKTIAWTINIEAQPSLTELQVKQLLSYIVSPTAIDVDGRRFLWRFGQMVPTSKIAAEIFNLIPGSIYDVDIITPTADVTMGSSELPVFDYVNTHIVIVPPLFM